MAEQSTKRFHVRGSGPGQWSTTQTVRCCTCRATQTFEATDGKLDVGLGQRWAREAKWSLTKQGWACPRCSQQRRSQRRRGRQRQQQESGGAE